MALFCAALKIDLFPQFRYPFHGHVQVFSLVCRLKYPYSCFSSHFSFFAFVVLIVLMFLMLLLAAVISLSLHFLM